MNKRKFLSLITGICLIFGLCACNSDPASSQPQKLSAPERLRYEDGLVLWDGTEHASGYTVWANGTQTVLRETSFSASGLGGTVTVKVKANGDQTEYADSDYCAPIVFSVAVKLASPQNFKQEGNLLSWDAVAHAGGYKLTVNGVSRELAANVLSYSLEDYTGNFTASLVALGQGAYRDSDAAPLNGRVAPALSAPQNFTFGEGVLHWDAVLHATAYDVYENGTLTGNVTAPQVTVSQAAIAGNYPVKIVAKAEGYLPAESAEVRCGYGSEFNPVPVSTQAELTAMQNGTCYALTADIALTEHQPLTLKNVVLSGGGHTVSGIVKPLFSELENCTVENVEIQADVAVETAAFAQSVGALCNTAKNSSFREITGSATLRVASTGNGVGYAGGLVGTLCGGSLENISLTVNVTAHDHAAGGLVALVISEGENVVISRCTVTGSVTAEGALLAYCGGVIGSAMTNRLCVTDTHATAIEVKGAAVAGGFAGYLGYGKIENCGAQGTVTAVGGEVAYVHIGGFVGHAEGYNIQVKNCSARARTVVEKQTQTVCNGAFAGMTPGGSYGNLYENCKYDGALNPNNGAGSGRGDGISQGDFSGVN